MGILLPLAFTTWKGVGRTLKQSKCGSRINSPLHTPQPPHSLRTHPGQLLQAPDVGLASKGCVPSPNSNACTWRANSTNPSIMNEQSKAQCPPNHHEHTHITPQTRTNQNMGKPQHLFFSEYPTMFSHENKKGSSNSCANFRAIRLSSLLILSSLSRLLLPLLIYIYFTTLTNNT